MKNGLQDLVSGKRLKNNCTVKLSTVLKVYSTVYSTGVLSDNPSRLLSPWSVGSLGCGHCIFVLHSAISSIRITSYMPAQRYGLNLFSISSAIIRKLAWLIAVVLREVFVDNNKHGIRA